MTAEPDRLPSAAQPPPRLAFIGLRGIPAGLPKSGGGESSIEEWAVRLAQRGYQVTVYCRWHYIRRPPRVYKGVSLISLPSIPTKSLDNITHSLLATLHAYFFNTADVIQYTGMGTGLYAPLGRLLGKKIVGGMDGIDWERPKWGRIARFFLRLGARATLRWSHAVHVDNAVAQRHFTERFGTSPDLITLASEVRDDPGSNSLSAFELEPGQYVLFVGLLKPDKGVHVLLDAYRMIDTSLPLIIVGDSPDSGGYVEELKGTDDSRVRFLGYVYGAEVQQLYANCRVYVQPSLMEGNSPSLMTAMSYGRPVVVSDIEQNRETLGGAGYTFTTEDPQSLASVLRDVLAADAEELREVGEAARERIRTVYGWDTVIDRLDGLYRRVAADVAHGSADSRAVADTLDPVLSFWRPLIDGDRLRALTQYVEPNGALAPGINVLKTSSAPGFYTVAHAGVEFTLFAPVSRVAEPIDGMEVLAEVFDATGSRYSHVLRSPQRNAVVLPFDPAQAIEAMRRECYVVGARRTVLPQPLLTFYYSVKRFLPHYLRSGLRGALARRANHLEHFPAWPIDDSLDQLQHFLFKVVMVGLGEASVRFAWFWPDGHPWAAILTHDVETAAGRDHIERMMEIESERGLRSSFNFVPRDYDTPASLRGSLAKAGFEVGVHGLTHDGLLFSSRRVFLQRAGAINAYARDWGAVGFRSPATYRNQRWFDLLEFEYDSSVSNNARFEPQPGGCASVFPFESGGLVELPITLPQDHTLFGLLGETTAATWLTCLDRIRAAHGMACALAHPDPAPGYVGLPENEAHYVDVLDALAASDAWTPLPRELARWWRRRAETPAEQLAEVEGMRFGTASLDSSGRLVIIPPEHERP